MIPLYPHPKTTGTTRHNDFFEIFGGFLGERVYPFSSARAALVFGLRALGFSRLDEILVPPFLSHCVLSAISRTVFPTMSPTDRTRAILVFHQFGFPQDMERISKKAGEKGWLIVNDCAQTLFSERANKSAAAYGDLSVFSLAKFFPILLGGAMTSRHHGITEALESQHAAKAAEHALTANIARADLESVHNLKTSDTRAFKIESIFGYLPEIIAFPSASLAGLPSKEEITADSNRRKRLLDMATKRFPDRVPAAVGMDVVPFAAPIRGRRKELEALSEKLREQLHVEAPVLNFDFAMNMLEPDYHPVLVLGCHAEWTEEIMAGALDLVESVLS